MNEQSPYLLNLDRNSLLGIAIGDDSSVLPVRWWKFKSNNEPTYRDDARGVEIGGRGGKIDYLLVRFHDPFTKSHKPFTGQVRFHDQAISLTTNTRLNPLLEMCGEPYWRDDDEDEILLFYEFGAIEWQMEFSKTGELHTFLIRTPPILADAAQRESYGVTKAWPPDDETPRNV